MEKETKEVCIKQLEIAFSEAIDWMNALSQEDFNTHFVPEKWSPAQHLYHLVKSTRAVNKGLKMPKLAMRTMFGKNNRPERSYPEVVSKYQGVLAQNVLKSPPEFSATDDRIFEKEALIQRFKDELHDLTKAIQKWDEESLSTYILPHPAIGKLTIRELIYFTIYHTGHHLTILKKEQEMKASS